MDKPRQKTGASTDHGKLYIYTGEELDAIAVAMHWTGPNGGWTGINVAKIALPSKALSQQQLNEFAKLFVAAPDLLAALKDAMRSARKDFKHGPDGDRQHREAYAEQFAAIAKAEGRK